MERIMRRLLVVVVGLAGVLVTSSAAQAQSRPYVGFVYPAGGQQGTTFQVRLGGQGTDEANGVFVSGAGVSARVVENRRRLSNPETTVLSEQLRALRKAAPTSS